MGAYLRLASNRDFGWYIAAQKLPRSDNEDIRGETEHERLLGGHYSFTVQSLALRFATLVFHLGLRLPLARSTRYVRA